MIFDVKKRKKECLNKRTIGATRRLFAFHPVVVHSPLKSIECKEESSRRLSIIYVKRGEESILVGLFRKWEGIKEQATLF